MEYELITPNKTFIFKETLSGTLDLTDMKEVDYSEKPNPTDKKCLSFNYEEINTWAKLILKTHEAAGQNVLGASNLQFLVQCAKIYSFAAFGIYYKAGSWINYSIPENAGYMAILRSMLGTEVSKGIFFEYGLGAFSPDAQVSQNVRHLIVPYPRDLEKAANKWFFEQKHIYTRVVGFGFRYDRFATIKDGKEKISLSVGAQATPLREPFNRHDPNAISIIYENGEKIGYVRSSIAFHLAPAMDEGALFVGRVTCVLGGFRDFNERVYVKLERV